MTDEKPKRKGGRKPGPPPQVFVTLRYVDSNGNRVEYDATDKSPDEYPDELKAAIKAKNERVYRDFTLPKFRRWVDGLKREEREALMLAARSEDPQLQKQFEENFLKWYDAVWGRKRAEELA